MPELLEESSQLESTTVGVFRTAATVKGGRRFSFNSLVVIGNRRGQIGWGYGKANEVPPAIEKAQKAAKRNMSDISLHGGTIPHEVIGAFGSARVKLMPASPGTGIVAGATVRAVLELLGITDCLTKCQGSNNKINVVKACFEGLEQLRNRETVAELRGVEIDSTTVDEMLDRGKAFMPSAAGGEKAAAPINTVGQDRGRGGGRGGRGGGGGRGGRGGGGGGRGRGPAPASAPAAAPAEGGGDAPAPESKPAE